MPAWENEMKLFKEYKPMLYVNEVNDLYTPNMENMKKVMAYYSGIAGNRQGV